MIRDNCVGLADEITLCNNPPMSLLQLNPSAILQTAFSFWSSKVLLTAVEFGVFSKLANRRLTGAADNHRLAILHTLNQPREVGLGFVDVHPLCHIRIIG